MGARIRAQPGQSELPAVGRFLNSCMYRLMPVDACIGRVNEVGATAINCQRYAYYACTSQRKLTFGARDSTSQIDVKRTSQIAAAYVTVGRRARLQGLPREGLESAPKPAFHSEREIAFTAQSGPR